MDEHMLKHHMIDEAGLIMKYNKDLNKSEAEAIILSNREAMEDEHLQAMEGNVEESDES